MNDSNLNPCNPPGMVPDIDIDPIPSYCSDSKMEGSSGTIDKKPFLESQKQVAQDFSWLEDATKKKTGNGESALCDPQQTGKIINDDTDRNVVYRYSKSIRGTDEAVRELFKDIIVYDESSKVFNVPIIWATQEKAVAYMLQDNTRKDESLVVDRIKLPMLAIHSSGYNFAQDRYIYHKAINYLREHNNNWRPGFTTSEKFERDTVFGVSRGIPLDIEYKLVAWTAYEEDMNQIFTQIITKFSPMAYIRVRDISWEVGVKLNSISQNVDMEPGDKKFRVFKYQFSFTAESFVAQPIVRKKAVLKTKVEITNSPNEEDITEIISRLEQAVKELEE